jgi:3-oxoacyl-(acyl-carrier-protein) synthase
VSDVGLTSMHVVDLVARLAEATSLELSPTLIYESVSLKALSAAVLERMELGAAGVAGDSSQAEGPRAAAEKQDRLVVAGMACRLPGDASTPADFWALLQRGGDAVVPPPADRPTNGRTSGYLSAGALMSFDAARFGVGAREAALMDPQQRLLLHAAYESFLDAGLVPEQMVDRSVGVFVGISQIEYASLSREAVRNKELDVSPYLGPAWSLSIAANRISYLLDLTGPSVALDTACSSSLVAVDAAINAIRTGACNAAIVAGVNVQLLEVWSDTFSAAGMLGTSQRCRFGSDDADGYVRGEGVGAVLIRKLEDVAPEARPQLYAEVVHAAVNQDGRSNGMTAPNPAAQVQPSLALQQLRVQRAVASARASRGPRGGDTCLLRARCCHHSGSSPAGARPSPARRSGCSNARTRRLT